MGDRTAPSACGLVADEHPTQGRVHLLRAAIVSSSVETECVCTICYESHPPPIQSGCACRGDAGFAHIECIVQAAVSRFVQRGPKVWRECHTCKESFTGAMQTGLAEAWWARVRGAGEESDLLSAAQNLGHSLVHAGKYTEAEQMFREVHGIGMRLLGPAHPDTMDSACEIAACLLRQGKYAHAEQLNRQVLAFYTRVLGPEDQTTLVSANNLASCLNGRLKHAEAEQICREVLAVRKRVLGLEHRDTLTSAGNLTSYLSNQGRHAEAEQLKREVHAVRKRVLGPEHPDTLTSAADLAHSLWGQGKHAEAEQICRELLAVRKRVLGPEHPETLTSASNVASSLASQARHAEAEPIEREVLAARKRVLGPEHPDTLQAATHLACSLFHQSKNVEGVAKLAAQIYNFYSKVAPDRLTDTDADPVQPTGLAEEYVDKQDLLNERLCGRYGVDLVTLSEQVPAEATPLHIATNAAHGTDDLPGGVPASEGGDVTKDLEKQKKAMQAQQLFEDTLEAQQRVLGPAHPDTLHTAGLLEDVRARIRSAPPTIAAPPAATGAARPLLLCALPPDGIAAAAGGGGSTDAQARRPSTQHKHAQARAQRGRGRDGEQACVRPCVSVCVYVIARR